MNVQSAAQLTSVDRKPRLSVAEFETNYLKKGLPVVIPDIGAFRERVAGRALSVVQKWDSTGEEWREFWRSLSVAGVLPGNSLESGGDPVESRAAVNFYQREYLSPVSPLSGELSPELRNAIAAWLQRR